MASSNLDTPIAKYRMLVINGIRIEDTDLYLDIKGMLSDVV